MDHQWHWIDLVGAIQQALLGSGAVVATTDPNYSSVSLLVHGNGTNGSTAFVDNSPFARSTAGGTMIARPNTTVSTTTPKFGSGSVDFGASALFYMAGDATVPFEFGANPFTVEAWGWLPSAPTATHVIACCYASVFNNSWMFCFDNSGANLKFVYSSDGTTFPSVSAAYAPATNTWIHFAADRDVSNVLRIYADGVVLASASAAVTFFNAATRPCSVGGDSGFAKNWPGRLDDIRITKGVARYAGAFTPPTAQFFDS